MRLNKWQRIVGILFLFLLLIGVRAFEDILFYDPFIVYFQNDYLYDTVPPFSGKKLLLHLFFRYGLNTLISLAVLYVAFSNMNYIRFAIKFYAIAFIVLTITFFIILKGELANGYLFAFYIRRFLIHPLFVLLLLPAFYYKQRTANEIT